MISVGISPMHLTLLIVVSIGIIGAIVYVCVCPPKNDEMDGSNDCVQENQKSDEIATCKGLDELKDHFFELSKKQNLPILLETSVPRNRHVYQRYGFEVYHVWEDSGNGNALWFMMRKP